jgi:hypothetical protein
VGVACRRDTGPDVEELADPASTARYRTARPRNARFARMVKGASGSILSMASTAAGRTRLFKSYGSQEGTAAVTTAAERFDPSTGARLRRELPACRGHAGQRAKAVLYELLGRPHPGHR